MITPDLSRPGPSVARAPSGPSTAAATTPFDRSFEDILGGASVEAPAATGGSASAAGSARTPDVEFAAIRGAEIVTPATALDAGAASTVEFSAKLVAPVDADAPPGDPDAAEGEGIEPELVLAAQATPSIAAIPASPVASIFAAVASGPWTEALSVAPAPIIPGPAATVRDPNAAVGAPSTSAPMIADGRTLAHAPSSPVAAAPTIEAPPDALSATTSIAPASLVAAAPPAIVLEPTAVAAPGAAVTVVSTIEAPAVVSPTIVSSASGATVPGGQVATPAPLVAGGTVPDAAPSAPVTAAHAIEPLASGPLPVAGSAVEATAAAPALPEAAPEPSTQRVPIIEVAPSLTAAPTVELAASGPAGDEAIPAAPASSLFVSEPDIASDPDAIASAIVPSAPALATTAAPIAAPIADGARTTADAVPTPVDASATVAAAPVAAAPASPEAVTVPDVAAPASAETEADVKISEPERQAEAVAGAKPVGAPALAPLVEPQEPVRTLDPAAEALPPEAADRRRPVARAEAIAERAAAALRADIAAPAPPVSASQAFAALAEAAVPPDEPTDEASADDAPPVEIDGPTASAPNSSTPATAAGPLAAMASRAGGAVAGFEPGALQVGGAEWRLAEGQAPGTGERGHVPGIAAAPREVAGQITLAVVQAQQPQVEIRLDPPELGRVQIRLNPTEGGGLQAVVLAERPETQDFLRRHADTLARDLNEAGYSNVTLEFAAGGDAGERDAAPDERRYGRGYDVAPSIAPLAEAPRRSATGGLDIRL